MQHDSRAALSTSTCRTGCYETFLWPRCTFNELGCLHVPCVRQRLGTQHVRMEHVQLVAALALSAIPHTVRTCAVLLSNEDRSMAAHIGAHIHGRA